MTPGVPIYCETGHPWLFMAEPVNTVTNVFIILAAFLAMYRVRNARIGFHADLWVLLILLFAVGIGSFLWHGFRTHTALAFDTIPGVLFLLVLVGLWIDALYGALAGVLGVIGMVGATVGSIALWRYLTGGFEAASPAFLFAPGFVTITLIGLWLSAATYREHGVDTAWLGIYILSCGVIAAVCRSIDLSICSVIPFGTHFLWHVFLSLAAYLGIMLMVRLKKRRTVLPS